MASDYGYNFGFRVSNESYRSGNVGDFRVPTAGDFFHGQVVEIDPAVPGFLKMSAADAPVHPGFRGLLIQENAFLSGIHDNQVVSTMDLAKVHNGERASIWTGAGLVFWLKNTAAVSRPGGRSRPAVTRFTPAGITVGGWLKWDGSKFVNGASEAVSIARVTEFNGTDYLEATILR